MGLTSPGLGLVMAFLGLSSLCLGAGDGIPLAEQHMSRAGYGIYGTEQPMSGAGDGISRAQ